MNCKNAKQRVLAALTEGTFDPEQGCRWPRDVIAAYAGVSEKTVSRAVAELEREGLRVVRPRRRGECNTYFVAVWNPPLRKRTVARLKKTKPIVSRLRESKCPPNRTAASQGSIPRGNGHSLYVVDQRCGREKSRNLVREEGRTNFERSRGVPEPARSLRLVHCPDCEQKDQTIASLESMVRDLEIDLANANGDLIAKRRQLNEAKAQVRKLRHDREQELKETPNFELIQKLAAFHRERVQPNARKPGARTIEAVRDRLADKMPESEEPAYSPRYVAEAILGARHDRWARDRGRDSLYDICQSPESLERFHRLYERAERRRRPVAELAEKAMREAGDGQH